VKYYTIRHVTRFLYSMPIRESMFTVYMQPRSDGPQHCLSFELVIEPRARPTSIRDYYGNISHHFGILPPHTQLTISSAAVVSTEAAPPAATLGPEAWAELDHVVDQGDEVEMLIPSQYARPTPLLRELARELEVQRRDDPLSLLRELNSRLHRALVYTPRSTRVDSPIDEALQQRRGVCQDYAHIMIALVRELGIPCRYVSGYLHVTAEDTSAPEDAATHAWVEALLPGLGWVGFDPTNDTLPGDRHIRVAIGRDYADVPPTRGTFKGEAQTELGVKVRIAQGQAALADDELLLVMRPQQQPAPEGSQPEQQQQSGARDGGARRINSTLACKTCFSRLRMRTGGA